MNYTSPEMKATKKLNFAQTAAVVEQPTSHDIESLRQTFEFKLNVLKNEMDHNLTGLSRRAPTNSSVDQSVDSPVGLVKIEDQHQTQQAPRQQRGGKDHQREVPSGQESIDSKVRNIPNAPPLPEPIPAQVADSHSEMRDSVCRALIHRHNMTIEANFNNWKKLTRIRRMHDTAQEMSTHKFHRIKTMINNQLINKLSGAFDRWKNQKLKAKRIEKGLTAMCSTLSSKLQPLLISSFAKLQTTSVVYHFEQ